MQNATQNEVAGALKKPPQSPGAASAWRKKTVRLRQRLVERGGCRLTLAELRAWLDTQRVRDWRRPGGEAAPAASVFFRCQYCRGTLQEADITVDHDLPVCLGGTATRENLAVACERCNRVKGLLSGVSFGKLRDFVSLHLSAEEQMYLWGKLAARPVFRK